MENQLIADNLKNYARLLYVKEEASDIEVCREAGIPLEALQLWVKEEGWETMRNSLYGTKERQLLLMYQMLRRLSLHSKTEIEFKDKKTCPEMTTILQLCTAINKLEKRTGLGEIIECGMLFMHFVQEQDFEMGKEITKWYDAFVQWKIKSLK